MLHFFEPGQVSNEFEFHPEGFRHYLLAEWCVRTQLEALTYEDEPGHKLARSRDDAMNDLAQFALREEERKTRQRKTEAENLILEAENLANSYGNAVIKRKTALRSKKYGSRETIILAGQEMQRARNGKEILLEKLERARLSSTQRAQITTLLNKIQN